MTFDLAHSLPILTRAAGKGDHAQHGGGGGSLFAKLTSLFAPADDAGPLHRLRRSPSPALRAGEDAARSVQ